MSQILNLIAAVAPPPAQNAPLEYDGWELRWKSLVFRPAMFHFEASILAVLGGYLVLFLIGRTINMSRAEKAFSPFSSILQANFSAIRPLLSSGPAKHLLYASGRRNVLCVHGTLDLQPYHDIATLIYQFMRSIIEPMYDGSEGFVWSLTLGRGESGVQGEGLGVWALVHKDAMTQVRAKRWDLSFPRLHENLAVPITHALFTEHSEVTDALLKTPNVGISNLMANPISANILKYLLITDQPAIRPVKGALPSKFRSREIVLSVRKPSTPAQIEAVSAWLQVILNIADLEAKPNLLRQDVVRKLASTRKTVDSDLSTSFAQEQAEDNPPSEPAEEKRLAKKKAAREAMTEKELKRLDQLEKKREMRKMAKKGGYKQQ